MTQQRHRIVAVAPSTRFDMHTTFNRLRGQFVASAMATPKVDTRLAEGPIATRVTMPDDHLVRIFGQEITTALNNPALNSYTPVAGGKFGEHDLRPRIEGIDSAQIFLSTASTFSINRALNGTNRHVITVDSLDAAILAAANNIERNPIFIRIRELEGVASGAIVIIPHPDDRVAYKNIEEHVRASIATSTQVLIINALQDTLPINRDAIPSTLATDVSEKWSTFMRATYGTEDVHSMVDHGASSSLLTSFELAKRNGRTCFMAPLPHFSPVHGMAQVAQLENKSSILRTDISWSDAMKEMVTRDPQTMDKTVVVITAPNNPNSTIPDAKELDIFLKWAAENKVQVIADLTYFGLVFSDKDTFNAVVKSFHDNGATCIFSASKSLSLLGDRISGVTHKDPAVITALESLRDELSGPPSVVSLLRLDHALTEPAIKKREVILEQFTSQIKTNHAKFLELVQSKGLEDIVFVPNCDGGLYVCMAIKGISTTKLAQASKTLPENPFLLLTEEDFGMVSGGEEGGFLRISLSGEPKIKEAAFRQLLELILETKK